MLLTVLNQHLFHKPITRHCTILKIDYNAKRRRCVRKRCLIKVGFGFEHGFKLNGNGIMKRLLLADYQQQLLFSIKTSALRKLEIIILALHFNLH